MEKRRFLEVYRIFGEIIDARPKKSMGEIGYGNGSLLKALEIKKISQLME
tara:strand:+ start:92 stop:241 length:150 start_codon:yes stop_codon:yes gene_type:complete